MANEALHPVVLTNNSTTCDLVRFLKVARDDQELQTICNEIDRTGKKVYGKRFACRFDPAIHATDFRNRVFLCQA